MVRLALVVLLVLAWVGFGAGAAALGFWVGTSRNPCGERLRFVAWPGAGT
jgi:hypothetical protein